MPEASTACRGVRGATTVDAPGGVTTATATAELLERMLEANRVGPEDVAAAIFTLDDDLAGENPAAAARAAGWDLVPLLMVREHGGDARVARCLRVLLLVNTTLAQSQIQHVYLRDASVLRPDLAPATFQPGPSPA
ncbi:MAG TPA: chorismate mutase [Actinomycetota bacterium]|nr:chorismate mutase [Actinomycetota bacterium]